MELVLKSLDELSDVGSRLLEAVGERRKITFQGEIGAGKTTLIKVLCSLLGVEEPVTSPTFSLINQYLVTQQDSPISGQMVCHIDLYRLKTPQEALDIGIEDYLYDDQYCFIEWPELIESLLPEDTVRISIQHMPDNSRKLSIL